ncbi:MAG: hypothetical protein DME09_05835 [Candidatus Rokuibacteriota bacterium]|nr:MAG: hypothetical protein DME09_05835 [Candidatus Rokubacteria bacterium]
MELVYYDGQTHPATVPRIYTRVLDVDKVDLVISGYATNLIAPLSPSRWSARRPSWVCSGSPITRGAPTSRLSRCRGCQSRGCQSRGCQSRGCRGCQSRGCQSRGCQS